MDPSPQVLGIRHVTANYHGSYTRGNFIANLQSEDCQLLRRNPIADEDSWRSRELFLGSRTLYSWHVKAYRPVRDSNT